MLSDDDRFILLVSRFFNVFHIKVNEKNKLLILQIFKFLIVGGIATLIDWIIFYLLYNILKIDPLVANIGSFSISVMYNYIFSIKWVFNVNLSKSKIQLFFQFMIFSILGLIMAELIIYLGVDKFLINAMIIKIISTFIVMIFNFVTRKLFLENK